MQKWLPVFLLAWVVGISTPQQAFAGQDDAWLILEKASQAARELSYQGVFLYQSGNSAKSVQITHTNYGQGEYARMVVLDGAPREVLSQGAEVMIFNPKNEKVVIQKRRGQNMFPALLPSSMDVIKVSYQVRLGGQERVGGRDGQVVYLDPKDHLRYGYAFWTDREYGILLKSVTNNEHNDMLEQIAFSQLAMMTNQSLDWFKPNLDHNKPYVMEQPNPPVPATQVEHWLVGSLPVGYRKVDQLMLTVPGKPVPVTQLIYSDGLASVSLFIEPLIHGTPPRMGHTTMGATNFYAEVNEGHQIIVVGEVPAATVAQFANAVSFKK
jgi:sigma-E factor negative regulatory protein RseB